MKTLSLAVGHNVGGMAHTTVLATARGEARCIVLAVCKGSVSPYVVWDYATDGPEDAPVIAYGGRYNRELVGAFGAMQVFQTIAERDGLTVDRPSGL